MPSKKDKKISANSKDKCLCEQIEEQFAEQEKCLEKSKNSIIPVAEKGKTFKISNQSKHEIYKIKIDKCLINDEELLKCDYLFIDCDSEIGYFVELKGTDIEHAYKQLITTIKWWRAKITNPQKEKTYAYMVSSSVPANAEQRFRTLKEQFKRDIGKELVKKNQLLEIII